MKKFLKYLGIVILFLAVLLAGAALIHRDKVGRLMATLSLFDEPHIVDNFSHMDRAFLTTDLPRGAGPVSDLPQGTPMALPAAAPDWIEARMVTSLLVLKDGAVVHESYHQGTAPDDRRISWSVAKSFLSVLMGTLVADGSIESLDDPVTRYAPELAGSAYDGATIRNVLNMASGIEFDEDYLKFSSDINKMGRVLALGGSMDAFAAGQDTRFADPGSDWQYVSIDTHVIGMVIRGATGRTIPDLMTERVIAPLGMERDPAYITDGHGVAFVLGGLNLTTRDYARFAQMVAQGGAWQGQQIVPAAWLAESTAPSAPTAPGETGYGYQWWIPADAQEGEFFARGIYGQFLYFDLPRGVVVVATSADRSFREPGVMAQNLAMFRTLARTAAP